MMGPQDYLFVRQKAGYGDNREGFAKQLAKFLPPDRAVSAAVIEEWETTNPPDGLEIDRAYARLVLHNGVCDVTRGPLDGKLIVQQGDRSGEIPVVWIKSRGGAGRVSEPADDGGNDRPVRLGSEWHPTPLPGWLHEAGYPVDCAPKAERVASAVADAVADRQAGAQDAAGLFGAEASAEEMDEAVERRIGALNIKAPEPVDPMLRTRVLVKRGPKGRFDYESSVELVSGLEHGEHMKRLAAALAATDDLVRKEIERRKAEDAADAKSADVEAVK